MDNMDAGEDAEQNGGLSITHGRVGRGYGWATSASNGLMPTLYYASYPVVIHYIHYVVGYHVFSQASYDLIGIVLIWKTAVGKSLASACTVAFKPMAASAPRIIPHGTSRNCTRG